MENSEVLNQDTSVPKDGAIQQDVEPIQSAPQVLEQNTNMYTSAKSAPVPVGEKDHASEIAGNVYNYNSEAEKEYDTKVDTVTTQSTGKMPLRAEWDSQYGMDDGFKATEDSDHKWNKLAAEMAQNTYDQEAAQYRAEGIVAKQELDATATQAFNNYFAAQYSAKQTQDKMGWTGGQEKASDLQVEFLQAETAANMYTQSEMQKYGMETKLQVARMYADANQKELALQYYQDAIDVAAREAELTGYYVSPEASEFMVQHSTALEIMNDPSATAEQKARAEKVIANCEAFYNANGFEKGYAYKTDGEGNPVLDEFGNKIVVTEYFGVKTLTKLQHEETVRTNKINEQLKADANDIARNAANASWANYRLAKAQFNWQKMKDSDAFTDKVMKEGDKTSVSHPKNYYETTDKNGNTQIHYINDEADNFAKTDKGEIQAYRYNGHLYVVDKNNNSHQVFINDSTRAAQYEDSMKTKKKTWYNNYKVPGAKVG